MGIAFKDLIIDKEISIDDLRDKILAVDSYNMLYQFLTTIRARDGTLLMDSNGNITSHLVGLFSRTTKLMQKKLKLVFVFDGKPPKLKEKEREKRHTLKLEAKKEYEKAKAKEDIESMKKYAARTSVLTPDMVKEAKKLIDALGLPIVDAPSEGEAQAAHIVKKEEVFATVSQDYDTLIHGSPKLIRNLSVVGKRKKTNKLAYETVKPEEVDLAENLNNLGIDQNQLIVLAMLVGTDYNPGGIKGIGPKNALKLVKKTGSYFDKLFNDVKWKDFFDMDWTEVYYLIKKMPVTDKYKLTWSEINKDKVIKLLVDEHNFSEERVNNSIGKLASEKEKQNQKGLGDFL